MPVLDNMLLAAPDQPGEQLRDVISRARRASRAPRGARSASGRSSCSTVFKLADKADDYAGTLSGGQRKLLELARALMAEPRLSCCSTSRWPGSTRRSAPRCSTTSSGCAASEGVTFLFVEHDMDVVMNHADRVIVMAEGRVIARRRRRTRSAPTGASIDAYLGAPGSEAAARDRGHRAEIVLEAEDLVAGYVPEVDILNGVYDRRARGRDRDRRSAPTAPASRR